MWTLTTVLLPLNTISRARPGKEPEGRGPVCSEQSDRPIHPDGPGGQDEAHAAADSKGPQDRRMCPKIILSNPPTSFCADYKNEEKIMKAIKTISTVIIILLAAVSPTVRADDAHSVRTVDQLYPTLAAGVLTYAQVEALPERILMKSGSIEISSSDIEDLISGQPLQFQAELKKNAFFVLEQEATGKLLKKIAAEKLSESGKDVDAMAENQVLQIFFEELTKEIKVTDQDIETFYKENESVFGGAPLESVRKHIEPYVLQEKQQRFVDQYIQAFGQKVEITVSDSWIKQQATKAKENPLDKARNTGKPTLAIFSAASCCGPDQMIPVKEALEKEYDGKINIVYIEPGQKPILAARYSIRSIPTQILYDGKGKEFFRHSGFLSEENIINKLSELEVR